MDELREVGHTWTHEKDLVVVLLIATAAGLCGTVPTATTGTLCVVEASSAALITSAQTGADLLATTAAGGRDLLLLVNGAVLVPVTKLL